MALQTPEVTRDLAVSWQQPQRAALKIFRSRTRCIFRHQREMSLLCITSCIYEAWVRGSTASGDGPIISEVSDVAIMEWRHVTKFSPLFPPMKKSWVVKQQVKAFILSNFGQLFGAFLRLNGSRPICTEVLFSNTSDISLNFGYGLNFIRCEF